MELNEFGKKLKELRDEKHLSQAQAGKVFHVTGQTFSRWETGVMEPDYDTLVKISKYFNVSTDYLLGLEDL